MKNPDKHSNEIREENGVIFLQGSLRRGGDPTLLAQINSRIKILDSASVQIDLSGVTDIDSLGVSLLAELEVETRVFGKDLHFTNTTPEVENGLSRYYFPAPEVRITRKKETKIVTIGEKAIEFGEMVGNLLLIISESFWWSITALWDKRGHRKGAITAQALSIGVGALPVIALISFLIGVVLTLQSAAQLRQFGANIFVADLIVVAMAREMGPLMTAILLAGRSGAAIAAEISTMTVNEETDALVTMALKPIRYVVVPKILGIIITAPLLSILSTVIGIFGGFIIAINTLDLTPQAFMLEAQSALYLKDIFTGLVKSVVFAWLIVILAAFYGFRVKGGPEGVGRATTQAVVASIFAVIVADSVLGLLFYL